MSPRPVRRGLLALAFLSVAPAAHAQSLHGSRGSVERMYGFAAQHGLPFYRTDAGVRSAVRAGWLVRLNDSPAFDVASDVHWPVATPDALAFLEDLGQAYRVACGTRLVVTSAVRPQVRQPRNASDYSVHPTGIAVDLRRPAGTCLRWLRRTLLHLEARGVIEATEERRPPHFHIAVLTRQTPRTVAEGPPEATDPRTGATIASSLTPAAMPSVPSLPAVGTSSAPVPTRPLAAAPVPTGRRPVGTPRPRTTVVRHRVRRGDSLWALARRYGTPVARIAAANGMRPHGTLLPGRVLRIPVAR